MNIANVKYEGDRPYLVSREKCGKYMTNRKLFGKVLTCKCGEKYFAPDRALKRGRGKFCSLKCKNSGSVHPNWKGGKIKQSRGYILLHIPTHPKAMNGKYVLEHRAVVEKQIGRYLHRFEVVHHINKIIDDNRPENLMAFSNNNDHLKFERGYSFDSDSIIYDGRKISTNALSEVSM